LQTSSLATATSTRSSSLTSQSESPTKGRRPGGEVATANGTTHSHPAQFSREKVAGAAQ
jgi:hypothetical protein